MGKASYALLCLILLVSRVFGQPVTPVPPVPEPLRIVVDNLSNFDIDYTHHFTFKDGSFDNGEEEFRLVPGERYEMIVDDDVASISTSYALLGTGKWNMNVDWKLLENGEAGPSAFWTIDDEGFWKALEDQLENPEAEETKICDWRSTRP